MLVTMPSDHLIRAIARDTGVRVCAAITTDVVVEAAARHALTPAATCAVGRALTSGLLLATMTKGGERVTVQLVGDGPIGSITVDATDAGDVRGYAAHPEAQPLARAPSIVAGTLGRNGVVNVLRDLGLRELYQGQVALTTGEVDEDVEAYLRTSEQVPSALGCEVLVGDDGRVVAAGGVLVQTLPDGDPARVREVQHALRTGRLREVLAEGERTARGLGERLYTAAPLEVVGDTRPVRFQCRCSAERIGEMLALLSTVDLDEMIADDKPAEVVCNYCNQCYQVERPQLERIRDQVAGHPRESN
jgi:molecular chaperone Hsp33